MRSVCMKKIILIAFLGIAAGIGVFRNPGGSGTDSLVALTSAGDDVLAGAFEDRRSNFQIEGEGTVTRILPDDVDGDRHQRFVLQLNSGQTLLVSHNIDLAPRIGGL